MAAPTTYEALLRALQRPDITAPEHRFLRAGALRAFAKGLHAATRTCDFPHEIAIRPEGVFVVVDGILLESSSSALYLKASGRAGPLQGDEFAAVLRRMNIAPSTIVDVGANFGEVSLALARAYPAARILAVEPSSDNSAIFALNMQAQRFPTQHIELVRVGIADTAGAAALTKGASTMNRVVGAEPTAAATEPIVCERLDTLLDRQGIRTADFVKIDIEGGEPKLKEAIVALGGRVRAYIIEFSQFAPFDDYLALARALLAQGFGCFDETAQVRLRSVDEIAERMRAAFANGPIAVTNFWFFAP